MQKSLRGKTGEQATEKGNKRPVSCALQRNFLEDRRKELKNYFLPIARTWHSS